MNRYRGFLTSSKIIFKDIIHKELSPKTHNLKCLYSNIMNSNLSSSKHNKQERKWDSFLQDLPNQNPLQLCKTLKACSKIKKLPYEILKQLKTIITTKNMKRVKTQEIVIIFHSLAQLDRW